MARACGRQADLSQKPLRLIAKARHVASPAPGRMDAAAGFFDLDATGLSSGLGRSRAVVIESGSHCNFRLSARLPPKAGVVFATDRNPRLGRLYVPSMIITPQNDPIFWIGLIVGTILPIVSLTIAACFFGRACR